MGYGHNGRATYIDRTEFPAPAIRFKEDTADVLQLREKEKGDWKNLSLEDKKACEFVLWLQMFHCQLIFKIGAVLAFKTNSLCFLGGFFPAGWHSHITLLWFHYRINLCLLLSI